MEDIIKKIGKYRESNNVCFDFANSKSTDIEKVMDMAFLIGKMQSQLEIIQIEIKTLMYKNK